MSFLQPWMLFALPLIALPILIHFMNQRRFQTMEWGATIFLLAANKMARGFARLRRWLILAARTLVITGLIFAIARPLASGWLGLAAGSRTDTTLILLDRSPSMSAMDANNVASKLTSGRKQLADALAKLNSNHWVLIDGATGKAHALEDSADLLTAAVAEPTGSSSDLPSMLQTAHEYIATNQTGRTDVWICSDLRQHDWDAEGGRWQSVRDSFLELTEPIRFYLLTFSDPPKNNRTIRVASVKQVSSDNGNELLVSLQIKRTGAQSAESIPIEFDIDGARSVLNVELAGPNFDLSNHRIALGSGQTRGWGRVSIPADSVASDNEFFFVFDEAPDRRTLIVTDTPEETRPLQLAAEIPAETATVASFEIVSPRQLDAVVWNEIALVLWQAPLPSDTNTLLLRSYIDKEGRILFMPPRAPNDDSFLGVQWDAWQRVQEGVTVSSWRGDAGLLENTQNGMALPIGELKVTNVCGLQGNVVPLASLADGTPLLVQLPTDRGGVFALATTTREIDSSLANDGVVLYVMIQRALQAGSARLAGVQQGTPGPGNQLSSDWRHVTGAKDALSTELPFHNGVFSVGEQLVALNRSSMEDDEQVLEGDQVDALFDGLAFVRVEDQAGTTSALIREIWRLFLIAMLVAMVAEAALCLPPRRSELPSGALT